jgi:hypothetical protein
MIPPGHKYACFLFKRFPTAADLPGPLQLGEGLWALRRPPVDPDQYWREWLGSIRLDAVRDANFVLLAVMRSERPEVVDGENQVLLRRVDHVFHGLLLQGVPVYEPRGGASLTGGNRTGAPDVREFADLQTAYPSYGMASRISVGAAQLTRAERLARVLERLHSNDEEWQRFRRGFAALFRGLRDDDGGRRLRLFVQALEGLIKPPIGESRRRFVHRCRTTIARPGAAAEQTLGQMYDIRSYVEHLHPPLDALTDVPGADRLEVGRRRTRQGEVLARFGFMHVLESPDLVEVFRSEDRIDAFWGRPDDERARLWGERLDLEAVT